MPIPRLVIDSSAAPTHMCVLGHEAATDKSPYNPAGHRHPYTPAYSLLFGSYKNKPIRFAEIGLAMGASAELWCKYFAHPDAQIFGFDRDWGFIQGVRQRVQDQRLQLALMDVSVDGNVKDSLANTAAESYDIIIDDSSHSHEHQIRIIREALPLVKPGGMLIIEDIFRSTPEEDYEKLIGPELAACAEAFFIDCEHKNKWSPGWDNDRLLVLIKA